MNEAYTRIENGMCVGSNISVVLYSPNAYLPALHATILPRHRSLTLANMTGFLQMETPDMNLE